MRLFHRPDPAARRRRDRLVFRTRPAAALRLRRGVQLLSLAVIVLIGWQFAAWVEALQRGQAAGVRPPGVEGFLPISALLSLRHLFETGEFSRVHPAGMVIFALALLTGLLLKKAFCSWICPVGTLSEFLARAGQRLMGRRFRLPAWLDAPLQGLKYLLLAYFVYAVFIQMTPRAVALFLESPYNKVADVKMLLFFTDITRTAAIVLGVLAALSFLLPYFWCRYLCPYGALVGVLSLLSPLKVVRVPGACSDCGRCAGVCPSFIAVDRKRVVHSPECTGCLDCVASCPAPGALQVGAAPRWRRAVRPAVFAALVVLLFWGGIGAAKLAGYWRSDTSEAEYARRIREIDSPKYHHARGEVPDYGPED